MTENIDDNDNLERLLDDTEIRNYFLSRDPDRKKNDPFLTEYSKKEYTGKASNLTPIKDNKTTESNWGISYSQHNYHINMVAKNYTWIGISLGVIIAIIINLFFNILY